MLIVIASVVVWILVKRFKKANGNGDKTILLWFTGVSSLFSLFFYVYLSFFMVDETEKRIIALLASDQVGKVEGKICNFKRKVEYKKYASVTFESFQIDSLTFQYDDYLMGGFTKFDKTYNHVLKNGLQVRVTFRKEDQSLQQIEIEDSNKK